MQKSLVLVAEVFDRIVSDPTFKRWMEETNIGMPGVLDDETHVWMLFQTAAEATIFKLRWLA